MNNILFDFDKDIIEPNMALIGTDEAGRGSGSGDVVAAAVYFPYINQALQNELSKLNDSKKLSSKQREYLYEVIIKNSIYDISFGSVNEIEKTNILKTSLNCMQRACLNVISKIKEKDIFVIIDGNKLIPNFMYNQKYIIKGDSKSASIAAASILAKVSRDRYMNELSKEFPEYKWSENKGYITAEHIQAVDKYGLTKYHRKKFFEKHFAKQLSLF